jgi:SAM-dependent methyltransferase
MSEFSYQGNELDLFQHAVNWKAYYAKRLRPYISGDVLEVGAGVGGTSRFLCRDGQRSWTCLEPDPQLATRLDAVLSASPLPAPTRVVCGTLDDLKPDDLFDTLLYIDVLEHIEDDRSELVRSAARVRPGGHVIVLSPAHQWLFSPFDKAIGHYRRYTARVLARTAPSELHLVRAFYLDSVGMLMSLANRALLRAQYPTLSQIRMWDSLMIPVSRLLDPVLRYRAGKTIVAVWAKG